MTRPQEFFLIMAKAAVNRNKKGSSFAKSCSFYVFKKIFIILLEKIEICVIIISYQIYGGNFLNENTS